MNRLIAKILLRNVFLLFEGKKIETISEMVRASVKMTFVEFNINFDNTNITVKICMKRRK